MPAEPSGVITTTIQSPLGAVHRSAWVPLPAACAVQMRAVAEVGGGGPWVAGGGAAVAAEGGHGRVLDAAEVLGNGRGRPGRDEDRLGGIGRGRPDPQLPDEDPEPVPSAVQVNRVTGQGVPAGGERRGA